MLSKPQPSLPQLFISFLRLGITAFGGPSMVAYIRRMAVERTQWLDEETFQNGVGPRQTIPGATAMQVAAHVGFRARGTIGAGVSFIGFGLPAFLLIMTLSALSMYTHALPAVVSAFSRLQAIIVAIVANATVSFGRTSLKSWKHVIIAGVAAALFGLGVNPIVVILLAALTALMLRIDLFAFGGGFASVPLMYHEIVEVRQWIDGPTFLNGIVLGLVALGSIVIIATFAGNWMYGLLGGLVATVSVFLPSSTMVVGFAPYFDKLRTSPYFNKVIDGVLCSFVGLLLTVTFRFTGNVQWDMRRLMLAGAAFVALLLKADILWVVVI